MEPTARARELGGPARKINHDIESHLLAPQEFDPHTSEREFVLAGRAIGATDLRIMLRIILPNALPPLIVSTALTVGVAILFESGLSFIGLGDPDVVSWGYMIGNSRDRMFDTWWAVMFPGLAIFLTVLSLSLIGDGLNDAFNPKLRER